MYPLIHAPGASRINMYNMLRFGRQIRDDYLWQFPLLNGAVFTYTQLASGRELKVSGPPRGVAKMIEWLQNAVVKTYDGMTLTGFEEFERRRSLDHVSLGRTMFYAPLGGDLEYLDPTEVMFDYTKREWYSSYTQRTFKEQDIYLNHPIPVGSTGMFMAPIAPIIPAAMLAWLIQEHDRSALDGRRLRDVIVVQGQDLANQIADQVQQLIKSYTDPTPDSNNIAVVYVETQGGATQVTTQDLIGRIGVSEIPEGYDRAKAEFSYVNQIAAALGLALRHFWADEGSTNRALEEVQEARQQQKGPASFVRSEQRMLNSRKLPKRFGRNVRMAFIEEVDLQSRQVNAIVLEKYVNAASVINQMAPGMINLPVLFGWLQSADMLPSDVSLLNPNASATPKPAAEVMENPDRLATPNGKDVVQASEGDSLEKAIDYGEISMTLDGKIIESRRRVFLIEKAIEEEMRADAEAMADIREEAAMSGAKSFADLLSLARGRNLDQLRQLPETSFEKSVASLKLEDADIEILKSIRGGEDPALDVETLIASVVLNVVMDNATIKSDQ